MTVLGSFIGQEFQGDVAAEVGILSPCTPRPATAAQLLQDAVMGDGLPDHVKLT
jgi:hypothetical protein